MNGSVLHVDPTTSAKMGANTVQFCIYPVYVIFGLEDGTVVKGGFIFLSRDLKHDRHQVGSCAWECVRYGGGSCGCDKDEISGGGSSVEDGGDDNGGSSGDGMQS